MHALFPEVLLVILPFVVSDRGEEEDYQQYEVEADAERKKAVELVGLYAFAKPLAHLAKSHR